MLTKPLQPILGESGVMTVHWIPTVYSEGVRERQRKWDWLGLGMQKAPPLGWGHSGREKVAIGQGGMVRRFWKDG